MNVKKVFSSLRISEILTFILIITSSLGIFPFLSSTLAQSTTTVQPYEITTRGNLPKPIGVQGNGYNNKYPILDIRQLFNNCPNEIAIIVHGWKLNETQAKERFDRVKMSLKHDQYSIPIVGFSWDSNMSWGDARTIANENGPKLAHFIFEYKDTCKHQHNKDITDKILPVNTSPLKSCNRYT
jgi:hypothetical protein